MIPGSPQLPAGTPGTKSPDGFAALPGNSRGPAGTGASAAFSTLLDAAAASSAPASDAPATTDAKAAAPADTAPPTGKLEAAPGKILPPGMPAFDKRNASARNIAASPASQDFVIGEADALPFKPRIASDPAAGPGSASDSLPGPINPLPRQTLLLRKQRRPWMACPSRPWSCPRFPSRRCPPRLPRARAMPSMPGGQRSPFFRRALRLRQWRIP